MVADGLGYSILNFPLKSTQTVDGGEFAIRPFKEELRAMTLGIARMGASSRAASCSASRSFAQRGSVDPHLAQAGTC